MPNSVSKQSAKSNRKVPSVKTEAKQSAICSVSVMFRDVSSSLSKTFDYYLTLLCKCFA